MRPLAHALHWHLPAANFLNLLTLYQWLGSQQEDAIRGLTRYKGKVDCPHISLHVEGFDVASLQRTSPHCIGMFPAEYQAHHLPALGSG